MTTGGCVRELLWVCIILCLSPAASIDATSVISGRGAASDNGAAFVDVPVCLMVPMFDAPSIDANGSTIPPALNPSGLHMARGLLLAVRHINSADCTVLGPDCDTFLALPDYDDYSVSNGQRIRLRPLLYNLQDNMQQSAPPLVQACATTEAQVIAGAFTSSQASLVASFVGGLGRLMLSSTASSPAFVDKALYPNFARTAPNQGQNMIALAHLAEFFGWRNVVVLHNQDLYGSVLAEVFAEAAEVSGITRTAISVGTSVTDADIERAVNQLVESELRVVVMAVFPTELLRLLQIAYQVITDAGLDYSSYTWIAASIDTETVLANIIYLDGTSSSFDLQLLEGLLGLSFHYPIEGRTRLETSLEAETVESFRSDIETYMSESGTWVNGSIVTDTFTKVWSQLLAAGTSEFMANTYDAVWAAAIGIAAAAAKAENGAHVTGRDVMAVMEAGEFPVFEGSGGTRAFLPNGDWDLSHSFIEISNYGTPPGASQPRNAVVARVELSTYSVTMAENVVWANGREYPYVPPDGVRSTPILMWVLIACAVGMGMVILLSGILVIRYQRLKTRVNMLMEHARNEIPLESPMAKMLDFLRRYQGSKRTRPTQNDACLLESLIVSHSNSLTVPDLDGLTDLDGAGIRDFLLSNMRQGGMSGATREPGSLSTIDSSADIVADDCFMQSMTPSHRESLEEPEAHPLLRSESMVEVPSALRDTIARDWFADLVTPRSPFRDTPYPLYIVVQQSVEQLGLLSTSVASRLRLLKFTSIVEAGYPDNNYHCKLHGADVTTRLMTMLSKAGLANLSAAPASKQAQSVGLVSMVAAMIHDYNHPQVNNTFLVEKESPMALEFNNQAVAEHFALRETLKLLMDSDTNFIIDTRHRGSDDLDGRSARLQRKRFRDMVIRVVLATDMSRHFELLSQFETQVVQNRELMRGKDGANAMWEAMNDSQRLLVLQIAMKVADIGHCALPMDAHRAWVQRLETEFFLQGDKEKEAGLNVSPLMDRLRPGATAPENQVGFFKVIVLPLLRAWTDVFPSNLPLLEQAQENLSFYTSQIAASHRHDSASLKNGKRVE